MYTDFEKADYDMAFSIAAETACLGRDAVFLKVISLNYAWKCFIWQWMLIVTIFCIMTIDADFICNSILYEAWCFVPSLPWPITRELCCNYQGKFIKLFCKCLYMKLNSRGHLTLYDVYQCRFCMECNFVWKAICDCFGLNDWFPPQTLFFFLKLISELL